MCPTHNSHGSPSSSSSFFLARASFAKMAFTKKRCVFCFSWQKVARITPAIDSACLDPKVPLVFDGLLCPPLLHLFCFSPCCLGPWEIINWVWEVQGNIWGHPARQQHPQHRKQQQQRTNNSYMLLRSYSFHQVKSQILRGSPYKLPFGIPTLSTGCQTRCPIEAPACRRLRADANSSLPRFGSSQRIRALVPWWMGFGWWTKHGDLDSKKSLTSFDNLVV